jgi:hypothetical protein
MAEFYVDGAAGDDLAPGTSARPLRTITRATELAAASPDRSGTIHVAAGTYEVWRGENFPILVPPGYLLAGMASSPPPVIRFHVRARDAGGAIVPFEGAVMMVAGAGLRRVVIEADPIPDPMSLPCRGFSAVSTVEDGVVFEDVTFRSRAADVGMDSFTASIMGLGNRGTITDARFEPGGGNLYWIGGACRVERSTFVGPWAFASFGPGEHEITNNRFTRVGVEIGSDTDAHVSRNEFVGLRGGAAIKVDGVRQRGASPTGPLIEDNRILDCQSGIYCEGPGTARFRGNVVEEFLGLGIDVSHGATPVFERRNVIRRAADWRAVLVRTGTGFPVFEETTFDGTLASPTDENRGVILSFQLGGPADFGGGGRSRGNNSFGRVFTPGIARIPGGGVITAHNNLWFLRRIFFTAPGTVVEQDGDRDDPARPDHWRSS